MCCRYVIDYILHTIGCVMLIYIYTGDRMFTDILFGNINQCVTILVPAINPKSDMWIVRCIRYIELCILYPLLK